jgi:hypothetical protein
MMRLIELARTTDIDGHLALVVFDQLLAISYRDRANTPRTFHMKISEFGYKEISAEEFKAVQVAAGQELFDFYSTKDDYFIKLLRRSLKSDVSE